jgi:PAS domain S-box-containing protein
LRNRIPQNLIQVFPISSNSDTVDTDFLLRLLRYQDQEHALVLLNPQGLIIDWLMAAEKMFGYQKEEVRGQHVEILFTPEDRVKRVPQGELEIGSQYGQQQDDRWLIRKDGMRLWVSGILVCLKDHAGKIVGFSKILRDRTDMKEKFDSLSNRNLELEDETRQKTIMMGTLAHELRNPLGALANAAQLIEMRFPQDQRLLPMTQLINRQVKYLATLVEDLLENVRLHAGKVKLETQPTDLKLLLTDAIEHIGLLLREKEQKIELLFPASVTLDVDPIRLKQVFINLLSNASKFSQREATIWIRALTEDEEIVVRVEDRGHGIPADILPHVFELFSQGQNREHRRHSDLGLGLGLSIVKQYVELHGGSVQARSEGVGYGSEFIVRLPLWKNGTKHTV